MFQTVSAGCCCHTSDFRVDVMMMLSGLLSFSLLTSGQCVVAVPSLSSLNPSFDLSLCRAKLENDGFQVSAHRHGYTYSKELLWHCKILHLNLC